jgi:hypothetical protein
MKLVSLMVLFAALSLAGETSKPVCNARNQGRFWPEPANFNRAQARQLYQSGELEMCSLAVWKYRWKHISVNVRDLLKARDRAVAASTEASLEQARRASLLAP